MARGLRAGAAAARLRAGARGPGQCGGGGLGLRRRGLGLQNPGSRCAPSPSAAARRPHGASAPPRSGSAGVLWSPGHGAAAAQRVEGRGRRAGPRQGGSGPAGRSKALGARGCRGGRPLPGCGPRCPHPAERHPEPRLHLGWVHPALFQPPAPRGGAGRRRPIRRRMQRWRRGRGRDLPGALVWLRLDQRPHPTSLHAGLFQFRAHCVEIIFFCLPVVFLSF